jgi:hypothetical protein
MPLGATAERTQPKYRVTEPTPASAPMAGVFRAESYARDAANGDVRTGPPRVSRRDFALFLGSLRIQSGSKPSGTVFGSFRAHLERPSRIYAGFKER